MRLLLHAIASPPETPPELTDFRGQTIQRVEFEGFAAWATPLSEVEPSFTRQDLLTHHHVVEAIFACVDSVLPARFPTIFDGEQKLKEAVMSRAEGLTTQLGRVRGCAELAVTALWTKSVEPSRGQPPSTPGRRYLLERQAKIAGSDLRRERAKQLANQLEGEVGSDLVEARHLFCPSEVVGLSSALLVRRWRAADLRERLVRAEQDVRILVNGPWPPYTFAAVGSD